MTHSILYPLLQIAFEISKAEELDSKHSSIVSEFLKPEVLAHPDRIQPCSEVSLVTGHWCSELVCNVYNV